MSKRQFDEQELEDLRQAIIHALTMGSESRYGEVGRNVDPGEGGPDFITVMCIDALWPGLLDCRQSSL